MTPAEVLRSSDHATFWPGASGLSVAEAYAQALEVRQMRIARGEQPLGYKVGFTNRGIWPRYGVFAPIWGTVWNTTLSHCEGRGELSLQRTCQPRLEPECVFGMRATPPSEPSLDDLLASVEWVAPGFEVVQSHQPDWKFTAPDTIADGGLHALLLVGSHIAASTVAPDAKGFEESMARARITLKRNGEAMDTGLGSNVLDGPLHALLHFTNELRACPGAPDLLPGDVVTTGTWTDAWPVAPGEEWEARFDAPLAPLTVRFR